MDEEPWRCRSPFAFAFTISCSHEFTVEFCRGSTTCDIKHTESRGDESSPIQPDANEVDDDTNRRGSVAKCAFLFGRLWCFSFLNLMYASVPYV